MYMHVQSHTLPHIFVGARRVLMREVRGDVSICEYRCAECLAETNTQMVISREEARETHVCFLHLWAWGIEREN